VCGGGGSLTLIITFKVDYLLVSTVRDRL